jgi:hypothetical protein
MLLDRAEKLLEAIRNPLHISRTATMFFQTLLPLLLAPLIAASPTGIDRRQFISANDLTDGNCKDTMFIFARGSTEVGNMVRMDFSAAWK